MEEYTKEKLYDIMNTTQMNYANMMKRLDWKARFSNFVVIYYSIALIIYSLTSKYYPGSYNVKLSEYFSIILSVIILAYSIINSNAKYNERSRNAEFVLNSVKSLKRELTDANREVIKSKYDEVVNKAEYRSDVDFFRTLKQKCKENDIRWWCYKFDISKSAKTKAQIKLNNYLSEIFPLLQQIKILGDSFLSAIIFIMPLIIFLLCFLNVFNIVKSYPNY